MDKQGGGGGGSFKETSTTLSRMDDRSLDQQLCYFSACGHGPR